MKRGELHLTALPAGHVYDFPVGAPVDRDLPPPEKCIRCNALAERVSGLECWLPERGMWVERSGRHCTRRSKSAHLACGHFEILTERELPEKAPPFAAQVPKPTNEGGPMPSPTPYARTLAELTEDERVEALSALLEHDVIEVAAMYNLNLHAFNVYRSRIKPGAHRRSIPSSERMAAVVRAWKGGAEPATLLEVFGLFPDELEKALAGQSRRELVEAAVEQPGVEIPLFPSLCQVTMPATTAEPPTAAIATVAEAAETVDHPAHYTLGGVEAIDVIEAWDLDFALGNAVKYIARAGRKGDALNDLRKAEWYIARAIQRRERAS